MIRRAALLVFSTCALLTPAAASAQAAGGQSRQAAAGPAGGRSFPSELVRSDLDMRAAARCVYKRAPTRIRALLETPPLSDEEDRLLHSLKSRVSWCFPPSSAAGLKAPTQTIRGAFAEVAYLQDFTSPLPAARPVSFVSFSAMQDKKAVQALKPDAQSVWALVAVADCIVLADAVKVDQLLRVPFASDVGNQALDALIPTLKGCVSDGTQAAISRQSLRAVLAEALYHYARTVAAPVAMTASARINK